MPLLRFLVFFLIGVAVTIWCYNSGVAYRVPEWFGYGPVETVVTPGPAVVTTPGAPPIVTEGPTTVVTTPPAVGLPPPVDGDGIDDAPPDVYPANGYPTNDNPPGDPAIVAKSDAVLANGSPLRVKIFRSETGFEARCTAYKIVNRSQRVLSLSFDPRHGERENVDHERQETLLKPGETLDEDFSQWSASSFVHCLATTLTGIPTTDRQAGMDAAIASAGQS